MATATHDEREFNSHLLDHLMDSAPILIAVVDQDLRYLRVSNHYAASLGRPVGEILGAHVKDVLPPEAYAHAHGHLMAALGGQTQVYELLLPAAAGLSDRILRVHYAPRHDASGVQHGFTMFGVEITSLKRSEEERLRVEAERRNEEKRQIPRRCRARLAPAAANLGQRGRAADAPD